MRKFPQWKNFLYKVYCKGEKSKWIRAFIVVLSSSMVTFLVARQIFLATLAFGDCPLITLSSGDILKEYVFSVWHRAAYGECYPSPQGYLFLHFFSQAAWSFKEMGVFNFLMNLSFPLGFLAFYAFSKRFCESIWSRLFAAALYVVNPVVITYYNFGGFMWSLVFLPLALLFFMDLLEKPAGENLAKAAAFTILTVWTFPTLSVTFLAVLFAITACYLMMAPSKSKFLRSLTPKLLILGLFTILCNAPYLLAQYIYSNSPAYGFEQFSILRDFKFTYSELTISNFIRLIGNVGSPQTPLGYNDPLNISNEIGLILPLTAFTSFYFAPKYPQKKSRVTALLAIVFILLAFVLALRILVYSELNWVVRGLPALWTIRNPIKLQLMLAICMIPLSAFSMEKIASYCMNFFRKKDLKKATLTFTLVLLTLSNIYLYNLFAFNGCMGLDKTYGSLQNVQPERTITNILEDSLGWYAEQNCRGIILPFDHQTELHVQFANPLLYTGRLGLNSKVVDAIDNELKSDVNLTNLFRLLSAKYVYINNAWRDTGFYIVKPQNLTNIEESLKKENLPVEDREGYSKFIIEPVLPRLYLSKYPVYYSNIETIKFLDSSVFSLNPVFLEIRYNGCQAANFNSMSASAQFRSYCWETPFSGVFDAYVLLYSSEPESTVHFSLDGGSFYDKTISPSYYSLKNLGRFELGEGIHKMLLATDKSVSFLDLPREFYGGGSQSVEGNLLKIDNGSLLTSDGYVNFDFNVDFKPYIFGKKHWNGPIINFSKGDYYMRLIFHSENYIELAKTIGKSSEGIIVKQAIITPETWYNLRIIKNNETLILYLNGEHLLSFTSPDLSGEVRVGVGSDDSITYFKNLAINKEILAGIWLFPIEEPGEISATFVEMNSEKYSLQFNQTYDSWVMLVLNENYDTHWEATLDGAALKNQLKANMYANCWFTNVDPGIHKIEICFKPNQLYQALLYVSIATLGVLLAAAYIPPAALSKIRFLRHMIKKKTEESAQI